MQIAVALCSYLFITTHYVSMSSIRTTHSLSIPQEINGSYESYTADIKFKYCTPDGRKFYESILCTIKNIVSKYTCHYRTDRDAVTYSYIKKRGGYRAIHL